MMRPTYNSRLSIRHSQGSSRSENSFGAFKVQECQCSHDKHSSTRYEVWSASINEAGRWEAGRLSGTNETPQPPPRSSSIEVMTHHQWSEIKPYA